MTSSFGRKYYRKFSTIDPSVLGRRVTEGRVDVRRGRAMPGPFLRIWGFADQSPVLGRPGLRTTGGSADLVTVTVLVAVVDG